MLGFLYAIPSGISASQFTRWHLDHHAELGSDEDDPKRAHLSPKVNNAGTSSSTARLRCSRFTSAPHGVNRRRIRPTCSGASRSSASCRCVSHLTALALLWYFFGFYAALRTSIIPVFFVFPVAFTLNRLGQHYDIDPTDPAKWGTLMRGSWFWDFAFLNSNYHLEHHYFPGCRSTGSDGPASPAAVLRAQTDALAHLRRARLRLARGEPEAPHRLGRDNDDLQSRPVARIEFH